MSQVNAGDVVTLLLDGNRITIKIEDASKSESISARIETSDTTDYTPGQIHEFNRDVLKNIV